MPTLYTVDEIAKLFRSNKQAIYNLINDGKIKAFKVGKRKLISQKALDEFLTFQ